MGNKIPYTLEVSKSEPCPYETTYVFSFKKMAKCENGREYCRASETMTVRQRGETHNCQMASLGSVGILTKLNQEEFENFLAEFRGIKWAKNQILMDIPAEDVVCISKLFDNSPDCELVLNAPYMNKTGNEMRIVIYDINADAVVDEDGDIVDPDEVDEYVWESFFKRRD